MSAHTPSPITRQLPPGVRIAIVAARFNAHLVDRLLDGCQQQLRSLGTPDSAIAIHHVPGAFELPTAAKWLAESEKFHAVICLGAVVRGDTPHFDYVAGECARGIAAVSLATGIPAIFGVLTTNTEQQAIDRIGGPHGHAGKQAADAAAEMIHLRNTLNEL